MDSVSAPARMSRTEVTAYNKLAHKEGRHLCPSCLRLFDWVEENFYTSGRKVDGSPLLHTQCKACHNTARSAVLRTRYQQDEAYRESVKAGHRARIAAMGKPAKALRALRMRKYRRQYERKRHKQPFDAATLAEIDLMAQRHGEIIWINRTLKDTGRRVCTGCRQVLALSTANFRKYGKRQAHVCRGCERSRLAGRS